MATVSDLRSITATLSGTTVDTYQLLQPWDGVEVYNHDATDTLYVTDNGVTPVAGAEGTTAVGPGQRVVLHPRPSWAIPDGSTAVHTIKVLGDGGTVSIEGLPVTVAR